VKFAGYSAWTGATSTGGDDDDDDDDDDPMRNAREKERSERDAAESRTVTYFGN